MNTNDTAFAPLPGSQKRPIALITGASRGIGAAIARTFAQAGYDLILTCVRNEDKLKKLCQELSDSCNICAVPFCGDMGDFDTVTRLFSTIRHLDVLVNNAGISHIGLLSDMTPEEWRRLMATNLDACFYTCRRCRGFHGSRLLRLQGRGQQPYESACKGACAQQYPRQRHRLRRDRHRYEPLLFRRGNAGAHRRDSRRPSGNAGGGCSPCAPADPVPDLSDRTDHHDRRRLSVKTARRRFFISVYFLPSPFGNGFCAFFC